MYRYVFTLYFWTRECIYVIIEHGIHSKGGNITWIWVFQDNESVL